MAWHHFYQLYAITLNYPGLIRQPKWVLQSASANRDDQLTDTPNNDAISAWRLIEKGFAALHSGEQDKCERIWEAEIKRNSSNLLLLRAVNQGAPHLLRMNSSSLKKPPGKRRIAVILAGELRCIEQYKYFLKDISRHADLFICTDASYAEECHLFPSEVYIVEKEPSLAIGSMQQWHKLAKALMMIKSKECKSGKRYTHILKLRTDFYHIQPKHLFKELVEADGLICASDKVFGGRRELMLLFEGFYASIVSGSYQTISKSFPVNVEPILHSDDSSKWYGMSFPKALVGEPSSVEELRHTLLDGGKDLSDALLYWNKTSVDSDENYVRFFKGNPRFASETYFARFLNFNAIPANTCPGLSGFLRSDRFTS